MSATPTTIRTGLLAACAALALTPSAALAKDDKAKGKDKHTGSPAVCSHDLPPGIAKKGGDLPPGIAKKVEGTGPPCDAPGGPRQGTPPTPAPAPASAPAPAPTAAVPTVVVNVTAPAPAPGAPAAAVATTVASSNAAPRTCTSRRAFRLRLDRKGRVRTARVTLNGKAIPVTRRKDGRASVLVDLRKRVAGTYTVRTTVVTRKGKLVTGTHRYRTCG